MVSRLRPKPSVRSGDMLEDFELDTSDTSSDVPIFCEQETCDFHVQDRWDTPTNASSNVLGSPEHSDGLPDR